MNYSIKTDGLRMINSTNTQTRRLQIISAFIKEIAKRQIPLELLKLKMIEWSFLFEKENPKYKNKNGKLTDNNKVTSAFSKYVLLMKGMGIIHQLGSVVSLTTTGHILYALINNSKQVLDNINDSEKLFYLYLLLTKDADYLLLILDMIKDNPLSTNQADLQRQFKNSLLKRLDNKTLFCDRKSLIGDIQEKKRVVTKEWENAESYSEHIIAPRLEWLIDLNILRKEKKMYLFTNEGSRFINLLLNINNSNEILEINNKWLNENAFNSFKHLFSGLKPMNLFKELDDVKKNNLVGKCMLISSNLFRSGSALRIGLQPSLFYSSIHTFDKENVVLEFNQIVDELKRVISYEGKKYQIKNAARTTEGYITIKINN